MWYCADVAKSGLQVNFYWPTKVFSRLDMKKVNAKGGNVIASELRKAMRSGHDLQGSALPQKKPRKGDISSAPMVQSGQLIESIKFNRSTKKLKKEEIGRVSATKRRVPQIPPDHDKRTYDIYNSGIITNMMNRGLMQNQALNPLPDKVQAKALKAVQKEIDRQNGVEPVIDMTKKPRKTSYHF